MKTVKTIVLHFEEQSWNYVVELFKTYKRNDSINDPILGDLMEMIEYCIDREPAEAFLVDDIEEEAK